MEKEKVSECLRCRTLLSAAMDGEATFNEAEFVRRHLSGCPDCREAQQAYHSLRAQLRLMPTPEPPAALRLAVMNRVHGSKVTHLRRRPAAVIPLLAPWQKGVFVTAALVLMFVAGFLVSMLLRPQPFEVEGQPVANAVEQKVVISFNRPVDRNYILENAPTLFTVKDAQNNPLTIDYDNIVVDGNTVELPIRRDLSQIQENEPIQVVVDSHIKDEKGAEVTNPGPKEAVVATQAPAAAPTKTKPGQVQAVVTTPVPPTSTATATPVPATTGPAPQKVDTPVSTTAPPTVGTTAAPTATITPTVAVSPTATTAPVTPTTVPATSTVTGSPTVTTTGTPTVGTTPTVSVSPTAPVTTTVAPTSTTARPTTTAVATTPPGTRTPGTATVPVSGTPVISATTSVGPSTSPGGLTPGGTVTGSPSASPTTPATCSPDALKGGFQKLYPATQERLGCPTAPQSQASFTYQVFQKGAMLYYQQTGRIYVFYNFGGWASYRSTGPVAVQTTNPPSTQPTGPAGTGTAGSGTAGTSVTPNPTGCSFTPRGSFGTLWRNNQAVQSSLGCPTGQDNSTSAGIGQTFSRGLMLYNPLAGLPYLVVYNDGGFQAFPNQ